MAMQEIARLTVEASMAFDRGDVQTGRARAKQASDKIHSIETRLNSKPGNGRTRSKLAEQRGRLQLEFLGDEAAAREAFEDALSADENPAAERHLVELLEREERRTAPRQPESGN